MSYTNKLFKLNYIAACVMLLSPLAMANVAEDTVDEHIEITGKKYRLAFPTLPEAKAELRSVAGGTNLIELNKLPARQATLQDALGFEAGVMMQSFFGGNDQPRLNVRGSGVQSNPVNRGVQLLYDGLPINASDGSFVIGFLDPKSAEMISVYRGANGLRYGATTLGGAINLMSRNGTSSPSMVRFEYGSDNRLGANLQLGGHDGKLDYFTSISADEYDGYRHHSMSERKSFASNVGYQLTRNIYNRTYFNLSDNFFEIPFVVPKATALEDPKLVIGDGNSPIDSLLNVYNRKPHRDSKQVRVANKTRISNDSTLHEFGVFFQNIDDTFTDPLSHYVTDGQDYGLEYAYTTSLEALSAQDNILVSVSLNQSDMTRDNYANNPQNGERMQQFGSADLTASNTILAMQWQAEMTDNWKLTLAGQWVNSVRDITDNLTAVLNQDKSYTNFNPKLGLSYQPSEQLRFFANISKTAEAPTFWELISTSVSPKAPQMASIKVNDLKVQSSTTIEFGTTGTTEYIDWDLSLYRTDIDDELISIVSDFAVNGSTDNYEAGTIHQGIELELTSTFTKNWLGSGTQIASKLVYNYSDFYFDGGKYKNNQIAGIPEHLVQMEISFTTDNGLYIAPNIRWQPEDAPVDHANTQFQDDHLLVGLKISYQIND
ncbi:MAG: TonB-dependent receptor, partial [Litorilituus sp.]|nr:TonB-dependent receptor [Litorilituus sp.]